jgi:hypothetical protein
MCKNKKQVFAFISIPFAHKISLTIPPSSLPLTLPLIHPPYLLLYIYPPSIYHFCSHALPTLPPSSLLLALLFYHTTTYLGKDFVFLAHAYSRSPFVTNIHPSKPVFTTSSMRTNRGRGRGRGECQYG